MINSNMDFSDKKILAVDDEPFILNLLELVLGRAGFTVITAENGQIGLELARKEMPDIILADLMMPVIDGVESCKRIRSDKRFKETFFIVLTARTDKKDRVKLLNLGADDFLSKPINKDELIAKMNAFMRIRNLQLELKANNDELLLMNEKYENQTGVLIQARRKIDIVQNKILKNEKLVSKGQIAAIVTGNINDPMFEVLDKLNAHRKYISDLKRLVSWYETFTEKLPDNLGEKMTEMLKELKTFKDGIDIEYLFTELDKNIIESIDEVNRVQKLIEKLDEFHNQTEIADSCFA